MISTRRLALSLSALALAATLAPALPAQTTGPYKILQIDKLGGEGGWDYLAADAATRQLYVARSGPTGSLHVYNLDTLAPLGDIPTGAAHGAAIDNATHHGFATSNPVTMFDTRTLKVIKTINTGGRPDGYLDDPSLHRIYVLSHAEPNVIVLDARDGNILGTINLGGAPEESELDNHGHLFIDVENKDRIAVVDTHTLKLAGNYDISSVGGGCSGLAIDRAHDVLFASCNDKQNMIILNAATGAILTTLPIGDDSDGATFNPATHEAFSTQRDGTLTIVKDDAVKGHPLSAADFSVEQTLITQPGARTITLDPKTGRIFTATADFGPAPAPQPGEHHSHPPMIPGSFRLLVIGK
jgi:DNA-binding beta-propeller fold protein YncE